MRAFAVYRRYYGFVRHALLRARVAEADVDDAVHEVFIVLLRKLGSDADGDDLRAWLFEVSRRIAANRRRAWLRHERKRRLALPAPATATPEDALARHEAAQQLADFLSSLDPDDRSVFRMAEIEGAPGRVVAERLGWQLHTAYRRMRSVRERFEATFGEPAQRSSPLRGLFAFPLRLASPSWAGVLAPAAFAIALLPSPEVVARVHPLVSAQPIEIAAPEPVVIAAAPVFEDEEDEIVVLDERDPPKRRRKTPRVAEIARAHPDPALVPEGLVVRARPIGVPDPQMGLPAQERPRDPAPGIWTGTFIDERGQPVAGARVLCRRLGERGGRRRCYERGRDVPRTDRLGRVAIRFAPGTYELLPFADGELVSTATAKLVTIE
jgi:RNA polymerase sigma-70 factor (ECF subfamily)